MGYKILAVNPGSTSTKITLFQDEEMLFSEDVVIPDLDYKGTDGMLILEKLREGIAVAVVNQGYEMKEIDAYAGRGGKMASGEAGVYELSELLLNEEDIVHGQAHACCYSPFIVDYFERTYGGKAFVLNSQEADELDIRARFTGYKDVWRKSALHVLNQKEVGIRAAKDRGIAYEEANIIVAHMGGGISVAAHKRGKMMDFSGAGGEGPMAPTRSGTVACMDIINMCYSGNYSRQEMLEKTSLNGGLMAHLGTADAREVESRMGEGDLYAGKVYDAMIYQIAKAIASMAVIMNGKVDVIALTGGMANSKYLVKQIRDYVAWIAPVEVYPGEYEMECLAGSVRRALIGEETVKTYTGIPVFNPKDLIEN